MANLSTLVAPARDDRHPTLQDGPRPPLPGGAVSDTGFRVYMLGGFRVERGVDVISLEHGDGVTDEGRHLFKWLLTRRTRRLPTDEAFDRLWPGWRETSTARVAIRRLRQALQPGVSGRDSIVAYDANAVWIRPDADVWVDADLFERLLSEAAQADDPTELWEQADRLYGGEYLPVDLYADWASQRRESLLNRWTELQFNLSRGRERRGDVAGAVLALQRVLETDRCDERAARDLMLLLARHGRRSEALRVYQRLVEGLREELEAEPTDETVEVHRQVTSWAAGGPATGQLAGDRPAEGAAALGGAAGLAAPAPPPPPPASAPPVPPLPSLPSEALAAPPFFPGYPFPEPETLVGREAELRALTRTLERGRRAAQIVMLGAPAGSGKSTLVGTVVREAARTGYLCLAGGSYDSESPLPYGPVRDALADYLLTEPADRLHADFADVMADLAHVVPELRYHVDLADAPDDARAPGDLHGAIHGLLRSLAAARPVLLCLEDLHAADGATIDLIYRLARLTRRLRLVLIGTYRSDEAPPALTRLLLGLTRERLAETVRLAPFDEAETGALITSLLNGPPDQGLRDSLYTVTEGNPLFVEQLVRALQEDGLVSQRDGVWEYQAGAGPVVPPLIRDVIGRRFDRIGLRCRQLLALAAVFGQTFDPRVLTAALGDVEEQQVLSDLDEAVEAQLVQENAGRFTFGHAMVREVLYNGLSTTRRSLLHEHAGTALERVAGERALERAAELANHFLLARRSLEIRAKALTYSLEAGRHAASVSAHREALQHFSQAYDLLQADGEPDESDAIVEALEGRANAEWALGLWQPLVETCERLLARADDPLLRARARGWIGHARQRMGDTETAVLECDTALAELEAVPQVPEVTAARLRLLTDKAYLLFLRGHFAEQAAIGAEMLSAAEALARPKPLEWAHNVLALAAMGRGQVDEALNHFERFREAAARSNDHLDLAMAHSNLGIQHQYAGDFARARTELARAVELCREAAAEHRAINTMQRLGWALLGEGDLEAALRQGEYASALASRAADRWAADCHDLLGTIAVLQADWPRAIDAFEQALHLRERGPHVVGRVETLIGLGLARQRSGDWPGARGHFEEALVTASEIDPSPWLVSAQRHLGRLLWYLGDPAGPDLVRAALALAETIPRSIEYGPTLIAGVEVGLWRDDRAGASGALERALTAGLAVEQRIEALCALAAVLREAGERVAAHERLDAARALAVTLGAPRTLWLVDWTRGLVAVAEGDQPAAAVAFEEAVARARAAGLPHELARSLARLAILPGGNPGRAGSMQAEARAINRQLGVRA